MQKKSEVNNQNCMMKCPDCSHEMNVCRSRIRTKDDPVCPGCGATLVPIDEVDKDES